MKLLSLVVFFISTVSFGLPLEEDNAVDHLEPLISANVVASDLLEEATTELADDDEAKVEVIEDTSLEFLDEQPAVDIGVTDDGSFVNEEHVISKRSTDVARSIWDSFIEFIKLSLQSIWMIASKVVLEPWFGINSLLSRIFRSLNANMQIGASKPGEPMVRYNLNGDFNTTNLLNWDYWTTHFVKLLTEQ